MENNVRRKMIDETNEEETKEIEVTETILDDEEIDGLVERLNELKENKTHIHFDIDEDNELLIHHEDDPLLNKWEKRE